MPDSKGQKRSSSRRASRRAGGAGWFLVILLVGVYVVIKFQVWGYAQRVRDLEAQLERLRPTLSAIVTYDHLKASRDAYSDISEQIQKIRFQASPLLEQISKELPTSITLEKVEAESGKGIRIWGEIWTGIRSAEAVLIPWAEKFRSGTARVRIERLESSPHDQGRFVFTLKVEEG